MGVTSIMWECSELLGTITNHTKHVIVKWPSENCLTTKHLYLTSNLVGDVARTLWWCSVASKLWWCSVASKLWWCNKQILLDSNQILHISLDPAIILSFWHLSVLDITILKSNTYYIMCKYRNKPPKCVNFLVRARWSFHLSGFQKKKWKELNKQNWYNNEGCGWVRLTVLYQTWGWVRLRVLYQAWGWGSVRLTALYQRWGWVRLTALYQI